MDIATLKAKLPSMKMGKRGVFALDLLSDGVISLVILAIVVVVAIILIANLQSNTTLAPVNGTAFNALGTTNTAIATVPTWFTVIIIMLVAVGLLSLIMLFKTFGSQGRN